MIYNVLNTPSLHTKQQSTGWDVTQLGLIILIPFTLFHLCGNVWFVLAKYRQKDLWMCFPYGPMLNYVPRWRPSCIGCGPAGHNC